MSCWIAVGWVDDLLSDSYSSDWQALIQTVKSRSDPAPPSLTRASLAVRALLAQMLNRLGVKRDGAWRLGVAHSGQPHWEGGHPHPWPYLSFSHSGEAVAAAISSSPVGIDIERVRSRRNLDGLIQEVCSQEEQERLCSATVRDDLVGFYGFWTLKEAWLKSEGEGVFDRQLASINTESASPDDRQRGWLWQSTRWSLACCTKQDEFPRFLDWAEAFSKPSNSEASCDLDDLELMPAMRHRAVGYAVR